MKLSLEDYYNAGVTPEEARDAIESVRVGRDHLFARPTYINENWSFEVDRNTQVLSALANIELRLQWLLEEKPDSPQKQELLGIREFESCGQP